MCGLPFARTVETHRENLYVVGQALGKRLNGGQLLDAGRAGSLPKVDDRHVLRGDIGIGEGGAVDGRGRKGAERAIGGDVGGRLRRPLLLRLVRADCLLLRASRKSRRKQRRKGSNADRIL